MPNPKTQALYPKKVLLITSFLFLGVPVFTWVFSQLFKPIFYDRYFIPSVLAWTILVAHFSEAMFEHATSSMGVVDELSLSDTSPFSRFWQKYGTSFLPLTLSLVFLVYPVARGLDYIGRNIPGTSDGEFGYEELPIVLQNSWDFLERMFYSSDLDRYFYVLDWEANNTTFSGLFGIQEHKHMVAIGRNYTELFNGHIVTSEEFLSRHNSFLVVDYKEYDKQCKTEVKGLTWDYPWEGYHCPQWVEKRLLSNPNYEVTELGTLYSKAFLLVQFTGNS